MVVKQFIQPSILCYQEGRTIVYLILRVGVRVILVALLAPGAVCHAAKALGGKVQTIDDVLS
jgi:hypothetical protein